MIDPRMARFPRIEESVDMSRGFPVICVKYRGFLHAPVAHLSFPDVPFRPGPHLVVLEYDTSVPQQPLLAVEITPEHV
jgi:hypothetical protein